MTTTERNTIELTMNTSAIILQTAREMLLAGLDQRDVVAELVNMYEPYDLSRAWFEKVVESSATIISYEKGVHV
jgi:hypothetical protein